MINAFLALSSIGSDFFLGRRPRKTSTGYPTHNIFNRRSRRANVPGNTGFEALEMRALLSDVALIAVNKSIRYDQATSGAVSLRASSPYEFEALVNESSDGTVTAANVTPPGQAAQALVTDSSSDKQFDLASTFSTQAAMDAAFPNGAYPLQLNTVHDGFHSVTLNETGNLYPTAPQLSNATLNSLQFADPSQPITLTWNAMSNGTANDLMSLDISDDNGDVFSSPDTGAPGALTGTSTGTVIPAGTLVPGTEYTIDLEFHKIAAMDTTGYPGVTAVAAYSVQTDVDFTAFASPDAPSGLTATALSTSAVQLNWTLNSTNDTSVNVYQWNGSTWQAIASLPAGTTTDTIHGLSAGTGYAFDVAAVNAIGTTMADNFASASTFSAPSLPAAPTALTATALSSSSIKVQWTLNDALDTSVAVKRWNGSAWIDAATLAAGATTFTDTGLSPSTAYSYEVVAVNNAGGTWAASFATATTPAAIPPAAPTGLSATVLSTTSIRINWTLPGATTSVDVKTWTGTTWADAGILAAGATTLTVNNLTPNTRYYYDVVAINANGATWAANYTTAVTFAAAPPAAPTALTASQVTTTVHLNWTLNGGGELYVFVAKWNGSAWQFITQLAAGTTSYVYSSPTHGANLYDVIAYNSFGWSAWAVPFASINVS